MNKSFIDGFTKRAAEYGLNKQAAMEALAALDPNIDYRGRRQKLRQILYAIAGAGGGALLGGLAGGSHDTYHNLSGSATSHSMSGAGALTGALAGGALGYGGGAIANKADDFFGRQNPWGTEVSGMPNSHKQHK